VAAIIPVIFVGARAYGQIANGQPAFEVASIKSATGGRGNFMRGGPGTNDPALYRCERCELRVLLMQAYNVNNFQLLRPSWMETAVFDVIAKVPEGTTKEQYRLMLQNLLAERFKLSLHRDKKEAQMYDLVVAKGGPKLKESAEGRSQEDAVPSGRPKIPDDWKFIRGEKQTTELLAARLAGPLQAPVTDATGLRGAYDYTLSWSDNPDSGPSLFSAIQATLGLKLEPKKGLLDIIVVDHAEKVPTEN
jgi:uncharacterized protein (TIGR03435 family)